MAFMSDLRRRVAARRTPVERMVSRMFARLPKGLYPRSILIVVLPMLILQPIVAYVFMERHWQTVTKRLSTAVVRDIAAVIEILETYDHDDRYSDLVRIAQDQLGLNIAVLPDGPLPTAGKKPFFSLLDRSLSRQIRRRIGKPFWIDTVGNSSLVEIRIRLDGKILRVFANRNTAYASNSEIFIFWMVGSSFILIVIALLFLRNQIRPIVRLARAADAFGKGRDVPEFRPQGAREVRLASQAFLDMRERIERQIEQRTAMLSGVSHDLRTILTRFQLELAMLDQTADTRALQSDIDEMRAMLQEYLDFAKGDAGENVEEVSCPGVLEEVAETARRTGDQVSLEFSGDPTVRIRPLAFRRLVSNLVANAGKNGDSIAIEAAHSDGWLQITIDDDGPGIPIDEREAVFRPFYRLDTARNVDSGGSGLGLAIARDVARGHGGDIQLKDSPLGGLRAEIRLPA